MRQDLKTGRNPEASAETKTSLYSQLYRFIFVVSYQSTNHDFLAITEIYDFLYQVQNTD